jgi:transposase
LAGHLFCGDDRLGEESWMPAPHPPEFRRRVVELARLRDKPLARLAADLGISQSCLRNWVRQGEIDQGHQEGLSSDERVELVRLRRELRVAQMEVEILKRASAYFARENILPKSGSGWSLSSPPTASPSR